MTDLEDPYRESVVNSIATRQSELFGGLVLAVVWQATCHLNNLTEAVAASKCPSWLPQEQNVSSILDGGLASTKSAVLSVAESNEAGEY